MYELNNASKSLFFINFASIGMFLIWVQNIYSVRSYSGVNELAQ